MLHITSDFSWAEPGLSSYKIIKKSETNLKSPISHMKSTSFQLEVSTRQWELSTSSSQR